MILNKNNNNDTEYKIKIGKWKATQQRREDKRKMSKLQKQPKKK